MQFDHNADYPEGNHGFQPIDFPEATVTRARRLTVLVGAGDDSVVYTRAENDGDDDENMTDDDEEDREYLVAKEEPGNDGVYEGYLLRRGRLKPAIYGRVCRASVVRKRDTGDAETPGALVAWHLTGEQCAVKEMKHSVINELRGRKVEDPIKELNAMQFIQRHFEQNNPNRAIEEAMIDSKVMPSRDALTCNKYLYNIMPFCNGGEFFDRLVDEENAITLKLSENEARPWVLQILDAIETMQNAGVTHRDMSLENLVIHDYNCIVIDMGMALRIPYENLDGVNDDMPPNERGERRLIGPLHACGKHPYMSPEIFLERPFDGHAVDLWAVGVILFRMVTGSLPWNITHASNINFMYMCRMRRLEDFCVQCDLGLSRPLMDLLQRMFHENPTDRLSLEQIRAHPWIRGGA